MTERCGTCKHWTAVANLPNPGWSPRIQRYDQKIVETDMLTINQTLGRCTAIDLLLHRTQHVRGLDDLPDAFTEDASMYKADLWTKVTFGCTMHEPR
ncbi:MAG: hypothetical protein NVS3B1_06220 [Marmoricola sp.]